MSGQLPCTGPAPPQLRIYNDVVKIFCRRLWKTERMAKDVVRYDESEPSGIVFQKERTKSRRYV